MTIAVHISSPDNNSLPGNFNFNCFSTLAGSQHDHHFIFLFDKAYDPALIIHKNITPVMVTPTIRNRLLQHYWYNFKLPRLLDKYNVDFFFSNGPVASLRTKVPQCMVLHGLLSTGKDAGSGDFKASKRNLSKFIALSRFIFVTNPAIRKELGNSFSNEKKKIQQLGYGLSSIQFTDQETQDVKQLHTGGAEYFLAFITNNSVSNILMLLKAFSAFKKRQLSNMKLVLLISSRQKEDLVKDFSSYKYREEVKMIVPADRTMEIKLVASAYACIYLPSATIIEDQGFLSIAHHVPLLTFDSDFFRGAYSDAALYTGASEKIIAENMMLLYKNENLRNALIQKAAAITATQSWEQVAGKIWNTLVHGAEQ